LFSSLSELSFFAFGYFAFILFRFFFILLILATVVSRSYFQLSSNTTTSFLASAAFAAFRLVFRLQPSLTLVVISYICQTLLFLLRFH